MLLLGCVCGNEAHTHMQLMNPTLLLKAAGGPVTLQIACADKLLKVWRNYGWAKSEL
jgi:hypothetical protein